MFRPSVIGLCGLFVVAMWILVGINFGDIERRIPTFQQFFSWPNSFWLWLTMGVAKFIHELGHGLSCKHYGGECHEIGMAFMVFSPVSVLRCLRLVGAVRTSGNGSSSPARG